MKKESTVQKAFEAYSEGHYKQAAQLLTQAAKEGHSDAQALLAQMFLEGEGVPQDFRQAFKWFQNSAEQGNAQGQAGLAILYEHGYGVEENPQEALKWYRKSAEQGYMVAQYSLGGMFKDGHLVEQNLEEAIQWLEKSALQGYNPAMLMLGFLYEMEKNNLVYAYGWYALDSSDLGIETAENLKQKMTAEQLKEAEKRLADLLQIVKPS